MIPDLPTSVSDKERMHFYSTLAGNLSDQSSIHVNWHTHRQNPSTCWICDMNILMSKVIHLTKSSLDMGTELSSEEESDSEIEDAIKHNIPEYDVEDEAPIQEPDIGQDEPE